MKRYIVLAAEWEANTIGWEHFRLATDDLEEAKALAIDYDWSQIVDLTTLKTVHRYSDNWGWDAEDARYLDR